MPLPITGLKLTDVTTEMGLSSTSSLDDCFTEAGGSGFDPTYATAGVDSLKDFRNWTGELNVTVLNDGNMQRYSSSYLSGSIKIVDTALTLLTQDYNDGSGTVAFPTGDTEVDILQGTNEDNFDIVYYLKYDSAGVGKSYSCSSFTGNATFLSKFEWAFGVAAGTGNPAITTGYAQSSNSTFVSATNATTGTTMRVNFRVKASETYTGGATIYLNFSGNDA